MVKTKGVERVRARLLQNAEVVGVNPNIIRLSLTLRESKESIKESIENGSLLKPVEATGEGTHARAFTQSEGEPKIAWNIMALRI